MNTRRLAVRLLRRGALIWAALIAVVLFAGAEAYRAAYPLAADRARLIATLGSSRGLDALYGRGTNIGTPGGFVAWRYGSTVATVVALWALLAVTRIMRGDEESGRNEILMASVPGPRDLLDRQILVFVGAAVVVGAGATVGCLAGGLGWAGALTYGGMLAAGAALFGALAAVTSQLAASRRRAASSAGIVLGASYLIRAIADASSDRRWLAWVSPLGWVEHLDAYGHPRTGDVVVAALAIVVSSVLLFGLAGVLRARRDAGAGFYESAGSTRPPRPLHSLRGLDWRLNAGGLVGWTAGVGVVGLVLGFIAADIAKYVADSNNIRSTLAHVAGTSVATIKGFLGLSFSVIAVVVSVYAGTQIIAARTQEESGRVDALLTSGAARLAWLATRIAVAIGVLVAVTVAGGFAAWAGVRLSGQSIGLVDCVKGAVSTVPLAVLFLGLTTLAFGVAPRLTTLVAFGAVALSYAILLIGGLAQAPQWVLDISPFSHLAPVPAVPADVTTMAALAGVGALGVLAGGWVFNRRDVAVE